VIRTERENCCDDLVVATNGNPHEYASALAALEENRWTANQTALAATGGVLMKRIRRLLYPRENPRTFVTPVLSAGMLAVVTALALTAWQSKPEPDRTAEAFQMWLNVDVPYIITDAERNAFQQLQTNEERQRFVEQFWERRNPAPGTAENPFKEEHYRRITYAIDHFASPSGVPGWRSDRGRMYITFGPPDEIDSHPGGSNPHEDWLYRLIKGIGSNVKMEFAGPEMRMTADPSPKDGIRR